MAEVRIQEEIAASAESVRIAPRSSSPAVNGTSSGS